MASSISPSTTVQNPGSCLRALCTSGACTEEWRALSGMAPHVPAVPRQRTRPYHGSRLRRLTSSTRRPCEALTICRRRTMVVATRSAEQRELHMSQAQEARRAHRPNYSCRQCRVSCAYHPERAEARASAAALRVQALNSSPLVRRSVTRIQSSSRDRASTASMYLSSRDRASTATSEAQPPAVTARSQTPSLVPSLAPRARR